MEVLAVGVGLWDWPPMSLVALKPFRAIWLLRRGRAWRRPVGVSVRKARQKTPNTTKSWEAEQKKKNPHSVYYARYYLC
jgi:hypothetical protein